MALTEDGINVPKPKPKPKRRKRKQESGSGAPEAAAPVGEGPDGGSEAPAASDEVDG